MNNKNLKLQLLLQLLRLKLLVLAPLLNEREHKTTSFCFIVSESQFEFVFPKMGC
jgi:hypothetical protein